MVGMDIENISSGSDMVQIPEFTLFDDCLTEENESFVIVAEIGSDVPDDFTCFKIADGASNCYGRLGATEVKIIDYESKTLS